MPTTDFLNAKQIAAMCGFSLNHFYRLKGERKLPRARKIDGVQYWRRDQIEAWLRERAPRVVLNCPWRREALAPYLPAPVVNAPRQQSEASSSNEEVL